MTTKREADEAAMDTLRLIDDYIADRLKPLELDEFEARLIWDEQLQDEVAITQRLRDGLGEPRPEEPKQAKSKGIRFAWAASIVAALGIGASLPQLAGPSARPSISPQIVSLEQARGGAAPSTYPSIRIGSPSEQITLLVYIDEPTYDAIRTELARYEEDHAWRVVWLGDEVNGGGTEALAVTISGRIIPEGVYRLRVLNMSANGPERVLVESGFRSVSD